MVCESDVLHELARKHIHWLDPAEACRRPQRVLASAMDSMLEPEKLLKHFGSDRLAEVLRGAEAGWFHLRPWLWWHRKLVLISADAEALPMPRRFPIAHHGLHAGDLTHDQIRSIIERGDRAAWEWLRDAAHENGGLAAKIDDVVRRGPADTFDESYSAWLVFR